MWVQDTFLGAGCPFLDSRTLAGWVISGYRQIGDLYFKNRQIGGFGLKKEPKWRHWQSPNIASGSSGSISNSVLGNSVIGNSVIGNSVIGN